MKLFVAIDPSEEVRARLAEALRELRPLAPEARWVRAESLHVTLAFVGFVAEEARAHAVAESVASVAARHAPFEVRFTGAGSFGPAPHPRVLWLALTEGANALGELASDLAGELRDKGFTLDDRPFAAHLTLARASRPKGDPDLATARERARALDLGSSRVERVVLYDSVQSGGAPRYEPIAASPLTSL